MNQIPLRDFQLKASEYLSDLPLELTRYGRVVCLVVSPQQSVNTINKSVNTSKKSVNTSKPVEEFISSLPGLCKHGAMKGNCKYGCR